MLSELHSMTKIRLNHASAVTMPLETKTKARTGLGASVVNRIPKEKSMSTSDNGYSSFRACCFVTYAESMVFHCTE